MSQSNLGAAKEVQVDSKAESEIRSSRVQLG